MEPLNFKLELQHAVEVRWADRWQIYQRLQELAIPCSCGTNEPLKVEITHAIAAVQLWSVMRQLTASRQDLIWLLERCWHHHS